MTKIQRASNLQQRQKRALSLRQQAEEALKLNRVSEAFNCIEQALRLDGNNPELKSFRARILLKEKVNQALSRAERAVASDRFEEALRAVEDALRSDSESVRAKSFKLMIEAKLSERRPMHVRTTDSFAKPKKIKTTTSFGKPSDPKRVIHPAIESSPGELAFENPDPVWTDEAFSSLLKPDGVHREEVPVFRTALGGREPVSSGSSDLLGEETMMEQVKAPQPYPAELSAGASGKRQAMDAGRDRDRAEVPAAREEEYPIRTAPDASPRRREPWSYDSLQVLEDRLAVFIGPLAKVVLRKAALQARSTGDLLELAAGSIKQRKDRQLFMEQNASWPQSPEVSAAISGDSTSSSSINTVQRSLISSGEIERASRLLAEYIGPLAGVLTKKASRQALSLEDFYLLLSKHVKVGVERNNFLRDVGHKRAGERS